MGYWVRTENLVIFAYETQSQNKLVRCSHYNKPLKTNYQYDEHNYKQYILSKISNVVYHWNKRYAPH